MLLALRDRNKLMMARLRAEAANLVSAKGEHYADILERLIDKRTRSELAINYGIPENDPSLSTASVAVRAEGEGGVPEGKGASIPPATSRVLNGMEAHPSHIGDGAKIEKSQLSEEYETRRIWLWWQASPV